MLAKVLSCAVIGLDVEPVQVEVDIANGLERVTLVGLPTPRCNRGFGVCFCPPQTHPKRR